MEKLKKVAAIHDLSGLGRCSLTVAIPILSTLGVQCCPYPTAVLSNQTGFDKFSFLDMTSEMDNYRQVWNGLGFEFDCIYTGFLGSKKQIDIVLKFIKENKDSLVVIDPVMGDNGILYDIYDDEMCKMMKKLIVDADIITPNLTEACILCDLDYKTFKINNESLRSLTKQLASIGPKKIIITGILIDDLICNFAYDKDSDEFLIFKCKFNNKSYSGTGDIFTSIITGLLLNGHTIKYSIKKATDFICSVIDYTSKFEEDTKHGIMFELFLKDLILANKKS